MRKVTITSSLIAFIACASLFSGCSTKPAAEQSGTQTVQTDSSANGATETVTMTDEKMHDITQSIPSPLEISMLVKQAEKKYNNTLLNRKPYMTYTSSSKQALNLGVYGTDLGYASIYNQKQEVLDYGSNVKKLADQLNIGQFVDEKAINRYAQDNTMLDSLLLMTQQNLVKITEQLGTQKREHLSVLMLTGGWIEAMHLAGSVYGKSNDKKLLESIGDQKVVLSQLLLAFDVYKDKPEFTTLLPELQKLQQLLGKVSYDVKQGKPKVIEKDGEIRAEGSDEVVMNISPEDGKAIIAQIGTIRNRIIEQ